MQVRTEELTDDALAGPLRVVQRRGGHRYSLDDTLVAWVAARGRPDARRVLDLGCGIGSVLLMLAHKLPRAEGLGVEAVEESFGLATRNVARNALGGRVRVALGDLRDDPFVDEICAGNRFDIVTGTPPYQPVGTTTPSPDPQRAHARIEMRGGVEDYVRAAARVMAPGGLFVVCADARDPERVRRSAVTSGLAPTRRLDVVPIAAHKRVLFAVWSLVHAAGEPVAFTEDRFVARDAAGARSEQAKALRRFFDLPARDDEAPSPPVRARSR